jgi:hypothetical protein
VRRAQLDPQRSNRGEPSEAKGRRDPEARQRRDWIRRIFVVSFCKVVKLCDGFPRDYLRNVASIEHKVGSS